MKQIIIIASIVLLAACTKHKFKRGDVVKYKVYANEALILDTFTRNGEPWYRVEDPKCPECTEVAEYELDEYACK